MWETYCPQVQGTHLLSLWRKITKFCIFKVVMEEVHQMHLIYHHDQQVPPKPMQPSKIPAPLIDPVTQIAPTVMVVMEATEATVDTAVTADTAEMRDMAPREIVLVVL
jgi:hypothetical protein